MRLEGSYFFPNENIKTSVKFCLYIQYCIALYCVVTRPAYPPEQVTMSNGLSLPSLTPTTKTDNNGGNNEGGNEVQGEGRGSGVWTPGAGFDEGGDANMSRDVCVVVCVPLACGGYGCVPFVLCMEVFSVYDVCLYYFLFFF